MCMICVDFQKQKMTTQDARRALREMREGLDEDHVREVAKMIQKAEQEKRDAEQSSQQVSQGLAASGQGSGRARCVSPAARVRSDHTAGSSSTPITIPTSTVA